METGTEHATKGAPAQDLGRLLGDEHTQLDRLFDEMLAAFQADARDDAMALWNQFESKLRAHMALEEERILPRLAEEDAPEAAALRREHDRLREKLWQLGLGVDLHLTRDTQVEEFIRELRAHAKRENKVMYRFCSEHVR